MTTTLNTSCSENIILTVRRGFLHACIYILSNGLTYNPEEYLRVSNVFFRTLKGICPTIQLGFLLYDKPEK
jgi:hypothetical protein